MWNGTRRMAEAIAQGIREADAKVTVKLFNSARSDKTGIIGEVFKSKTIVVGSPTVNKGVLSSVAGILEEIRGLGFKNKKGAAFGAYGWSGEAVKAHRARSCRRRLRVVNAACASLVSARTGSPTVSASAASSRDNCSGRACRGAGRTTARQREISACTFGGLC
jgi:flavorubredoxin